MKLDRLLGITMELLTNKRVPATKLASRFEVSIRTIYRDIELINQSGIPIVSFSGTDGGFEIMDGFFLSKQHFSIDDFSIIYSLLEDIDEAVGGKKFATLANKLSSLQPALLDERLQKKIVFDMSTSETEKEVLPLLIKAIDQVQRITFTYTDAFGQVSKRKVEPLNLLWEKGIWYLDSYCLLREDRRLFRATRITELELLDETFFLKVHDKSSINKQENGIDVHLRFDSTAYPRVFEQFPDEYTYFGAFVDVKTIFYSREYALSVILSYGSKVKILSPDSLKKDLVEKTNEILQIYF
ncbi:MAG: YafY family transcriptional regulator [Tetragenococcus koreensis]|uniref:helix-turn-helix transcriptional regulator n=1 Tax=Tetragenococcus halophilus TaxID=51669 RepID=UPI001F3051F9|nr:YafY family protein [Tetragenococcus halophilus]MDN6140471.1 YafY family transcriptional regulator [Tetragenococcus koreensis]MDN6730214.1 YafY family transcriptional regulator [Alkalibacterium sp.]MDN6749777.1 YafY family transcriptional regulator [Staphylococcus equorum]MCF1675044.1 YafY family transcriptional regulator [Tetragenococcus halophilus]MDN6146899.1 YafY family transcriptional regulator [Tetragenococcus koreensis]